MAPSSNPPSTNAPEDPSQDDTSEKQSDELTTLLLSHHLQEAPSESDPHLSSISQSSQATPGAILHHITTRYSTKITISITPTTRLLLIDSDKKTHTLPADITTMELYPSCHLALTQLQCLAQVNNGGGEAFELSFRVDREDVEFFMEHFPAIFMPACEKLLDPDRESGILGLLTDARELWGALGAKCRETRCRASSL